MTVRKFLNPCNLIWFCFLQASSTAAAANAAKLDELNRKLKSSEDELDALNKRFDEAQGKPDWSIQILHYRVVNAVFLICFNAYAASANEIEKLKA